MLIHQTFNTYATQLMEEVTWDKHTPWKGVGSDMLICFISSLFFQLKRYYKLSLKLTDETFRDKVMSLCEVFYIQTNTHCVRQDKLYCNFTTDAQKLSVFLWLLSLETNLYIFFCFSPSICWWMFPYFIWDARLRMSFQEFKSMPEVVLKSPLVVRKMLQELIWYI